MFPYGLSRDEWLAWCCDMSGMTDQQVAYSTGASLFTVKKRIGRARRKGATRTRLGIPVQACYDQRMKPTTDNDQTPATVEVPVELIRRIVALDRAKDIDALGEYMPKPKPTPRLVAVDPAALPMGYFADAAAWFDTQPDLLTLLDREIEEVGWRMYGIEPEAVTVMKARIRAALGVDQ